MLKNAAEQYTKMEKENIACPLCGGCEFDQAFKCDRYCMGVETTLCRNCGFLFTNPRPTEKEMVRFYRQDYRNLYTNGTDPEDDVKPSSPQYQRAERLCRFVSPHLREYRTPAVLDAGCGSGSLFHFLRMHRPESRLYGVEPDASYAKHAAENYNASVYTEDIHAFAKREELENTFDLIVLNHVLEHLYQPVQKLESFYKLLKPGGLLLVEVPNWLSPHWDNPIEMLHLAHVNHFSPKTLEFALELAGFRVIKKTASKLSVNPWAMTFLGQKKDPGLPKTQVSKIPDEEWQDLLENVNKIRRRVLRPPKILLPFLGKTISYFRAYGLKRTFEKSARRIREKLLTRFYPVVYFLLYPSRQLLYHKQQSSLRKLIENQKILILGSGPSVSELETLPEDYKVFTCNRGLKFFSDKKTPALSLYMCTRSKIERLGVIEASLKKIKTEFLVTDDLDYVKRNPALKDCCSQLVFDDVMDDFYLKELIRPLKPGQIRGRSHHPWTSTGIRLLQYALHFKAGEIYLAGIDFGNEGYFWGENKGPWFHADIDQNFMKIVSQKYDNVFSISSKSLASKYLKVKKP